ncbi:hypothetical protein [Ulvibacter antarcticus]|uniref:DUF1566 domain-containing protein n=1 Tax=Ulvibacter antarcticus TaxID=442714 RepID=A0A3L9YD39_9FLAO|nr:hypothetical protein [Ulvibacter antarcticus]RMA58643.1 hypothetical protein BXY75_2017 [Ulvibacter antarcticus]
MKSQLLILSIFLSVFISYAQVGINTVSPNATLQINATNSSSPGRSDGILIPRVDNFSVIEPLPAQDGMLIFVSGDGTPEKGFYYWDSNQSTWIPLNRKRHYVGELYEGGIVYHVDEDGQHGLIASLNDLGSSVSWGLSGVDVNNCEDFIDGATNTASIISAGGPAGSAAGLCNAYAAGGFTDWYLPALIELKQMADALVTINPILINDGNPLTVPVDVGGTASTSGFYWSSTEGNATFARNYTFTYFDANSSQKWQTVNRVRAIRSF